MNNNNYFTYDIECFPNFFSIVVKHEPSNTRWEFEISEWHNQGVLIMQLLAHIYHSQGRMVGYSNMGYDWPMLDLIWQAEGHVTNQQLYNKSQEIVNSFGQGFGHTIWQPAIPQIDLFKIHHFDNKAKMTSLKLLEFNMRMDDIQELPYDPRYPVTYEESRHLLRYNHHDVNATGDFLQHSMSMIEFRDELTERYGKDFTNANDTKIGADFFVMELKKAGIDANKNNQTHRYQIKGSDIIFPYIQFQRPEFNVILDFFRNAVIDPNQLKGFFTGVSATVNGFRFDFGAGGIHGSMTKTVVESSDTHSLIDSDVASYYPNLAIANSLYPEHLSSKFCDIYLDVYNQRKSYAKGSPENAMLKLALNGVYGKSNDIYSEFYDPQYTVSITINGQLLLCMLAEWLMTIEGLTLVQINTDGLTYLCPKGSEHIVTHYCNEWEKLTKLELEHADYDKMCIRDVNSYLAVVSGSGKVKRIGAYAYELALNNPATREMAWHKNQSAMVIPKAAEAFLVYGIPVSEFIHNHSDIMDFMLRTKVPKSASLVGRTDTGDIPLQNITRYYVSNSGVKLIKLMEPTDTQVKSWKTLPHWYHEDSGLHKCAAKAPSGKYRIGHPPSPVPPTREIGIESAYVVTPCNNMKEHTVSDINYDYYINETKKLCLGLEC